MHPLFSVTNCTHNIRNISIVFIHISKLNTPHPHLG